MDNHEIMVLEVNGISYIQGEDFELCGDPPKFTIDKHGNGEYSYTIEAISEKMLSLIPKTEPLDTTFKELLEKDKELWNNILRPI